MGVNPADCPAPSHQTTIDNLQRILSLNATLNSSLNLDELLGIIMNTAAEVMCANAASLLLLNEKKDELLFKVALGCRANTLKENFTVKLGEGIAGTVAQTGQSLIINDVSKDPRFAKRFDDSTGFKTTAILCVPMRAKGKLIGVLQAINPVNRATFNENDLKFFEIFSDQAAIAVENARLHAEEIKQEKAKQELSIAHEIQQSLLPDLSENNFGIDIGAISIPARHVGGDFYDAVKLGGDKTALIIGDVSGKGVPAALYMVKAISEFRFLVTQSYEPAKLVPELNNRLAESSTRGMFITLIYLVIDKKNRTVEYSSAGHHAIVKRLSSGASDILKNIGGPPAGLMPGGNFEQITISIAPGEVLVLFTDGITEARNKKGIEFQYPGIQKSLEPEQANAGAYAQHLVDEVQEFATGMPQHDDLTILTLMLNE